MLQTTNFSKAGASVLRRPGLPTHDYKKNREISKIQTFSVFVTPQCV